MCANVRPARKSFHGGTGVRQAGWKAITSLGFDDPLQHVLKHLPLLGQSPIACEAERGQVGRVAVEQLFTQLRARQRAGGPR